MEEHQRRHGRSGRQHEEEGEPRRVECLIDRRGAASNEPHQDRASVDEGSCIVGPRVLPGSHARQGNWAATRERIGTKKCAQSELL